MKHSVHYILWGMLAFLLVQNACQQDKPQQPSLVPDPTTYRNWKRIPVQLDYPVPGHQNNFRIIYVNPTAEQVQRTPRSNRVFCEFPEGAIIIKEVYEGADIPQDGEQPKELTVMIKQPEHPQARNGWLWLVKQVSTGNETVIDYELCNECHANANEPHPYGDGNPDGEFRDYVYFPPDALIVFPAQPEQSSKYPGSY